MIKTYLPAVAALAALTALTGCSSSGSHSGSTTSSSPSTHATSSATASPAVAQALAAKKQAATFPTTIPVTAPLPSAPPKGKTIVYLQCEQQECPLEGNGIKAATQAIGWNFKVVNFQAANPATLVAALKTALQYHPVGVFFAGAPQATWASEQSAYAAAGSFITESFDSTAPTGKGVLPGRSYAPDNTHIGQLLADEQIADAGGAPGNSILVNVPDYAVFQATGKAYTSEITSVCSSCHVIDVDVTLPQLLGGQLNSAIVSAAKRASDVKYIVSVNGSFTAQLPQALSAAGLAGKYKIISGQGTSADQHNVLTGTQLATINSPLTESGWQDVDMAIRKVMNLPIPQGDHEVAVALLDKSNIGTPKDSYDLPADYATQFKKLWQVG
ncbi:sugar ABC transporter substrate-binding protein [uncultured Jatrophihabitans sp.]|uniref:sugar ABC transporter substrate-binding protein n=1 Tax=uncultured Jatrophihabitans sp. TaxID=1610747 RepID=UPI0035C976EE